MTKNLDTGYLMHTQTLYYAYAGNYLSARYYHSYQLGQIPHKFELFIFSYKINNLNKIKISCCVRKMSREDRYIDISTRIVQWSGETMLCFFIAASPATVTVVSFPPQFSYMSELQACIDQHSHPPFTI